MDCRNWVVKASKEDEAGLINFSSGDTVKFWWFDGRRYKDNTADAPEEYWTEETIANKFKVQSVDLKYDAMGSVLSFVPGAAATVALAILTSF